GEEIKEIKKRLRHKKNNRLDTENIHRLLEANELNKVEPLYTTEDAEKAITAFDDYPYRTPVTIGRDMTCTFYDAGHILGSAISVIKAGTGADRKTIMYSGDIGRFGKPILRDPTLDFAEEDRKIDLLIMESTYGDRTHDPVADLKGQLQKVVAETLERKGTVVIPSFAFGRTQDLLYTLHELYNEGALPKVPIFIDSPLAIKLTRVFGEHPEVYDQATHKTFLEKGQNPFSFDQVNFVSAVEESMALMRRETSHIAIAASGMCEAGRILHHLRYRCHNPLNTILIVGYMAQYTLGRRMLDEGLEFEKSGRKGLPPTLKILGKEYPLKARVARIDGFSAHGDRNEMLHFLKDSNLDIKRIAVVHGEEEQCFAFAKQLEQEGYQSEVPKMGETIEVK
ncbi:MAG: MBL fold metallo-hydrolase RNA specificity domain-containing protein, partial [bacterium]|nr:MBL fold metallo-hydrolase RNA specificity domain-containing protein [bacterium]